MKGSSSRRREHPPSSSGSTVAFRAAAADDPPVGLRQGEQLRQLRRQLGRVAGLEAREVAQMRRVLLLETIGDLGQAGVAGDERRRARGGGLRRDHPECLREDRRDDRGVGEREQVDEVAVLERAGEERARAGRLLQRLPVVAEADDHGARVDLLQRLEQDVDALVEEQLPEVDDGRLVAGEEGGEAFGVALVRQPLVRAAGVRRIAPRLLEEPGQRLVRAAADATRRRRLLAAPRARGRRARRRPRAPPGCAPSRRRSPRACASASRPHAASAALPRIEYSSSEPCALTAKRAPLAAPTGAPSRTWFAKTRSAGRCSRSAAAFRSTHASSSARVQS